MSGVTHDELKTQVKPGVLRRVYGLEASASERDLDVAMQAVDHYIRSRSRTSRRAGSRARATSRAAASSPAPAAPAPTPTWPAPVSPFGTGPLPASVSLLTPTQRVNRYGAEAAREVNATVTGVPTEDTLRYLPTQGTHPSGTGPEEA
jgi:hypothetical protein